MQCVVDAEGRITVEPRSERVGLIIGVAVRYRDCHRGNAPSAMRNADCLAKRDWVDTPYRKLGKRVAVQGTDVLGGIGSVSYQPTDA